MLHVIFLDALIDYNCQESSHAPCITYKYNYNMCNLQGSHKEKLSSDPSFGSHICAVILVNPCFIQVHDIIPCFPKRFDLSQIITSIIDNRHLVIQNSSIITYFFISISKINESQSKLRLLFPYVLLRRSEQFSVNINRGLFF